MNLIIRISDVLNVSTDYLLKGVELDDTTETPYSRMLKSAIKRSGMSLTEIEVALRKLDVKTNRSYLSKLQNGNIEPAGDKINIAISSVLHIDPIEFRTLAYLEKIPTEIIEQIKKS
ncbi:transcriptional regulator with XRE-family HTH domain [Paenibacillus sp. 1182]|nr:transcriptional regulator with XRE-family HTH domain [Paenibacillus sp. 1182]